MQYIRRGTWPGTPPQGLLLTPLLKVSSSQSGTSLVAQMIKRLPTMRETWVQSLGWKMQEGLQEGLATQSSILAWKIPWTEEPGGLQSMRSQRVGHD